MNGARDLACRRVRAARGLERARLTVVLAREVDHRAFFGHSVAWLRERAMIFPQLFAAGADVKVALWIEGEVAIAAAEDQTEKVKAASQAFYAALDARDPSAMAKVYAHTPYVVHIDPTAK